MHAHDNVCQTRELTYVIGHANARSHLWKFATWSFPCRGLTVVSFLILDLSLVSSMMTEIGSSLFITESSKGLCRCLASRTLWINICGIMSKWENEGSSLPIGVLRQRQENILGWNQDNVRCKGSGGFNDPRKRIVTKIFHQFLPSYYYRYPCYNFP